MKQRIQMLCVFVAILSMALVGCKKHVAAAPPPAPAVQPAPPPAAPVISLRATPNALDRGQSANLQWEARNAASVRIEPDLGSVSTTGTRSVSPASSVTYTATATGAGGTATDTARITVRIPAPPARTENRTPARVNMDDLFRQNVQTVYFDFDKSDIRPDQVSRLQANAAWLKQHPELKFTVDGNCDQRGNEEYNLGLGDRRANAVKEFLIQQGVSSSDIKTVSYGKERLVCTQDNESCYQQNRRAGFVLGPIS